MTAAPLATVAPGMAPLAIQSAARVRRIHHKDTKDTKEAEKGIHKEGWKTGEKQVGRESDRPQINTDPQNQVMPLVRIRVHPR
jgi:hypothetical protein